MDEILIHETKKVSAVKEAPEFLESGYDEKKFIRLKTWVLKRRNKTWMM